MDGLWSVATPDEIREVLEGGFGIPVLNVTVATDPGLATGLWRGWTATVEVYEEDALQTQSITALMDFKGPIYVLTRPRRMAYYGWHHHHMP